MVWYSHLFQNFPQFIVIHTVKGFGIVSKGGIDVFLELSCFLMIQQMVAISSHGQKYKQNKKVNDRKEKIYVKKG